MPSFIEISPLVQEMKIFEGFLPYMGMAAILIMFQIPLIVAIWLALEQVVINYASSMVDILSQRLPLQRDFAHNAH